MARSGDRATDSAAITVVSMKSPAPAVPGDGASEPRPAAIRPPRRAPELRALADVLGSGSLDLGRLAPPRDGVTARSRRARRARRTRGLVAWAGLVLAIAAAVSVAIWLVARRLR